MQYDMHCMLCSTTTCNCFNLVDPILSKLFAMAEDDADVAEYVLFNKSLGLSMYT